MNDMIALKKVFVRAIDKYNERKEFYEHYLQISAGKVMIITWRQSWHYVVCDLEQSIMVDENCENCGRPVKPIVYCEACYESARLSTL